MNNKEDNIKKSLKEVFDNYQETLLPHQWENISSELKKDNKKGFIYWKNIFYALFFIIIGAVTTFFIFNNKKENIEKISRKEVSQNIINEEKINKKSANNLHNNEISNSVKNSSNNKPIVSEKSNTNYKLYSNKLKSNLLNYYNSNSKSFESHFKISIKDILNERSTSKVKSLLNPHSFKFNLEKDFLTLKSDKIEDTVKMLDSIVNVSNKVKNPPSNLNNKPSKLAISFSVGTSNTVDGKSQTKNSKAMHKDFMQIYNQSEKGKTSRLVNLGIEYYFLKKTNLNLKANIQYREIENTVYTNYTYSEIPWRDIDGTILGYFTVNDSQKHLFHFEQTNQIKTSYLQVPLRISYNFPISTKHEFSPSLGINISKLLSTKGNLFSIDDIDFLNANKIMSKKINIRPMIGFQYSFNLHKNIWIGAEYQWQQMANEKKYQFSSIKSIYNQNNLNFILKYKL